MWTRVLILTLAFLLPACSSSSGPPAPPPVDLSQGLTELGDVYKYRAAERLAPPAKVADLADNEAAMPNAWPAIQDGRIVVAWKVGLASSSEVLAYEKDAASSGGSVLLRNGTVKKMTAAEFAAAPKAK